ncbi:hypothetical protein Dred_1223 [Desulforamulus reducens MI-1]|uniref:Uncharacterized protein n=1 Tax=Desulforamulus reducens (strain ATCC BAA-1160 / DSM 100696 / MI-1) TaxID=349161 RepID=A4J3V4_DESRM|nr:hypothetical protein [Desulforamulus reducens]ABO49757.1 hypothetical protein Dred_1223 [Desulforamulus reducens MI-1]
MGNISESATWDAGVYQIEETDPVQGGANGIDNMPHKNLANRTVYLKQHHETLESEVSAARGGYANLGSRLDALETQTMQGESVFASTSGKTVTHNLGNTNYIVNLVALADTGGDLGDVYISKAANAFTVYNTGGFTGAFRYQIMT